MTAPTLHQIDPFEAERAADAWGFSCGPAAICAVTGLTPEQVRPHLGDFKGYMTPSMMLDALRRLERLLDYRVRPKDDPKRKAMPVPWPTYGICRVQWGGPWCAPGVPPRAAYRETHWIAAFSAPPMRGRPRLVFDVNGLGVAPWMSLEQWDSQIVPIIIEDKKRADGTWWITHAMECRP